MRRLLAVVLSMLSAVALAGPPVDAEIAAKTVRADVFPKTPARFPGGILAQPDVEYANLVGWRPLLLDLYTHQDPAPARPLVVWVHGGGWNRGDSRGSGAFADYPAVLAALAARGYVVASVNYRLTGEAPFPAQVQDVKAAIRFLRANAGRYGIDPARVVLWGGSAGGHLAALAAASCGLAAFEPRPSTGRLSRAEAKALGAQPAVSDCVQAAVIWYGVFDLGLKLPTVDITPLVGCARGDCDMARLASPIAHVDAGTPPMLLVHGTADKTVPIAQSERMAERLRAAGVPVETLFIAGVDHGLLSPDVDLQRHAGLQALQRSFDFIDAMTGRP